MSVAGTICVSAAAVVFGVAGSLKLREEQVRDRVLGVAEIAVAAAMLVPGFRPAGLAAGLVLAATFVAVGISSDRPCRCFGQHFTAASRRARVVRAGALVALCGGGLAGSVLAAGADPWHPTSIVIGIAVAALVIVLPSLAVVGSPTTATEWSRNV